MTFVKKAVTGVAAAALLTIGVASPALATPEVLAPFDFTGTTSADAGYNYVGVSRDGSHVAVVPQDACVVTIVNTTDSSYRTLDLECENLSDDHGYPVFSPDGGMLYVPNYASDWVEVYDLSDDSFDRHITGMNEAWSTEISPDGNTLYVLGYDTYDLFKVDLTTDTVTGPLSQVGETSSMCISADGSTLYVPDYITGVSVVDLTNWTLDSTIEIGADTYPYGCELDNNGDLIINAYENSQVARVALADGTVTLSAEDMVSALYAAVPTCETIYLGDEGDGPIGTANLTTLELGDFFTPAETPGGEGWYSYYGGDRSADGSIVALPGYYGSDALTIIKTPECASAPSPELPNTGVDTTAGIAAGSIALVALAAGAFVLVARRRQA